MMHIPNVTRPNEIALNVLSDDEVYEMAEVMTVRSRTLRNEYAAATVALKNARESLDANTKTLLIVNQNLALRAARRTRAVAS